MHDYYSMYTRRQEFEKMISYDFRSGTRILNAFLSNFSGKVLDFGCGSGSFKMNPNIKYYGYDIDKNNKLATFNSINQIKEVFDLIVFSHVIEHMDLKEVQYTLHWAAKHGKNIFILSPAANFFSWPAFYADITHIRPYASSDFAFHVSQHFSLERFALCGVHTFNPFKIVARLTLAYLLDSHIFNEFILVGKNKAMANRH